MTISKKQAKISKMFRKGFNKPPPESEDDGLQEEIQLLEQRLRDKHNELFQLQRNSYRGKPLVTKKKKEEFTRPKNIILENSVENHKRDLELMAMLSGMEVQSFVENEHCCIVYHMQHDSKQEVKHGLRIEMKSGKNEVSRASLPLGFNFDNVLEDFDDIMMPDCLSAIRKGLVAYYDRLEQYEALKKLVNVEAQLFKVLDGSHIEISFLAKNDVEEDEQIAIVLTLNYMVYDIRPKTYAFREVDLPEGAVDALKGQCAVFKRKPLRKAFKEAFIDGIGPYKLVPQIGVRPSQRQTRRPKRFRPNRQDYNNDDTFHPEDCSDQSDDYADE